MTDPSEVVLRYTPEKWIEAQERLGSASPSRFVTLSYHPRDHMLSTPSPSREQNSTPRMRKHIQQANSTSTEYFVRPISESLERLANYGKNPDADVQVEERAWYHDLTNVGQRLRLLRETFKVIQLVRKKRMMGERADFKMLHEFRTSHTGSPLVLDDDGHSRTEDEDETNASSAPELPPPPPPNRRGRPRRKQMRGRKPGLRRETADAPTTRTRASRRVQDPVLLSLLQEQTVVSKPATGEEEDDRNLGYSSPPEASSTQTILHLPPILPSQRLPLYHGQQPTYGMIPYIPSVISQVQPPQLPTSQVNASIPANAPQARTASLSPNTQGSPPLPTLSIQKSATPYFGNLSSSMIANSSSGSAPPPVYASSAPTHTGAPNYSNSPNHSRVPSHTSAMALTPTLSSAKVPNAVPIVSTASSTPNLSVPNIATPTTSTSRSTPNIPNHSTPYLTTQNITNLSPNLGGPGLLHSSALPTMRIAPSMSERLIPHFAADSRNPLPRVDAMTGSFAMPHAPPGFVPSQGNSAGIRLPPLQWGTGAFSIPGMPLQSLPTRYFPGAPPPEESKES